MIGNSIMRKVVYFVAFVSIFFTIAAISGCSSSSSTEPTVDVTPPPVPTGLTIDTIGNGAVELVWNPVSAGDLKGYDVYWCAGAAIDTLSANVMFVTTPTATVTILDYVTMYSFAVASVDKSGNESALSSPQSGKPLNTTDPSPPTGLDLVAENIDFPKITLFWLENNEPDLAYYNVYRATDTISVNDSLAFHALVTQNTFIDADVEVGVTYYYQITAVDKELWESRRSATVTDMVLDQVTLISPANFGYVSTPPVFSWEPVPGASKYTIFVYSSRLGGEIWSIDVPKTLTQVTYSGKTALLNGNTYWWRVGTVSLKEINSVSPTHMFTIQAPH